MKELKTEKSIITRNGKKNLLEGITLILLFCIWTYLIQSIDVYPVGVNESDIGFATINTWFHNVTFFL